MIAATKLGEWVDLPCSSMGRPIAMHLSLGGILRTPEEHREAYHKVYDTYGSGEAEEGRKSLALRHKLAMLCANCCLVQ
ncbi:hypothetical protein J6590_060161 [Homalodisca vitripennis]|nr:hypothetical protein J6590_060161 [Homalodisca vitripennis]